MSILAICPAEWLGVRKSISRGADTFSDIAGACAAIRGCNPDEVRFGGYDPTWRPIVRFARDRKCRIVVTVHHTPALHELAPPARTALVEAIKDYRAGLIDRFETPHEGVARTLSALGVPCTHRRNVTAPPPTVATPRSPPPGVHIGIFGTGQPWKNTETQMLAAALVINDQAGGAIHVQHVADTSFLEALGVEYELHPGMNAEAFSVLLASMTVNLAVNFTETFGYLAVESFLLGVPCLFSPMTQAFFELDAQNPLWCCRVERIDDPAFISARIGEVLARRERIAAAGIAFCSRHVANPERVSDSEPRGTRQASAPRTEPPAHRRRGILDRWLGFRARRRLTAPLEPLFDTMGRIRETSDVLAVTPAVVRYYWLGVNRAAHALFPGALLELPSAIAGTSSGDAAMDALAQCTASLKFSQVVLNGFPACAESLAKRLRDYGIRVGCLFHGFLAECGQEEDTNRLFHTMLQLCRDGVIFRLACNKKGLPQTIERLAGIKVYKFMVPTRVMGTSAAPRTSGAGGMHIGVLAYDLFRKNIHNQVAAALLIDGATVHVAGQPKLDYWGCNHRLVRHPEVVPHRDFVALLGQMDLNLHLSFSESWGQVTAESLAVGVPCMIANCSDIYDHDPVLRDRLVSSNIDDPNALAQDIQTVLNEREGLAERGKRYVDVLNQHAEAYLKEFLAR